MRWPWIVCLVVCLVALVSPAARAEGSGASFAEFDRRAKAGEPLNVVFFGASLTWGANASDPLLTSYRGVFADRLREAYPLARFRFWDGAIGGTGSQLGIFRLERDVLRHKPDLVLLDFSANDDIESDDREKHSSYEALVRRIIVEGHAPVVQAIFPFRWNIEAGKLEKMKRRTAHKAISDAYHTGWGDAIELGQKRVAAGETTLDKLWPYDGVHPGDAGYAMFADAVWSGFQAAVAAQTVCQPPEKMLFDDTYMTSERRHLAKLEQLPAGWHTTTPNVLSAYFDMMMSRWLDDEVVAVSAVPKPEKPQSEQAGKAIPAKDAAEKSTAEKPAEEPPAAKSAQTTDPLSTTFRGSMVLLFGESTPKSGRYRVLIDGQLVEHREGGPKTPLLPEFDAGVFAKRAGGNVHHVQVIATGLDPQVTHAIEIEPIFDAPGQELRLESLCTAGAPASK